MEDLIVAALAISLVEGKGKELEEKMNLSQPLKGPRGFRGRDGRDFDFEEYRDQIAESVSELVKNQIKSFRLSPEQLHELKMKFSDLSDDEIDSLRGPRGRDGRDGRPGRDFDFEENRDSISSMVREFANSMKEDLKLRFKDLSAEDKAELSFKFENFTNEQIEMLKGQRGPRGSRGQKWTPGDPGRMGPPGAPGIAGKNAASVSKINLNKDDFGISFEFVFSDGSKVKTNSVEI